MATTYAVITPTIGTPDLKRCIESVAGQDCLHYLVVDGKEHFPAYDNILLTLPQDKVKNIRVISLEENVGKGWYGHRVYAAIPFLVNADVICYLDEDNFVEPDYIEAFREVERTTKYQWAYTLRNVVDQSGTLICRDDCESLGHWPVFGVPGERHHIDTSCFAIPRKIALAIAPAWYGQWGADRQFYAALVRTAPHYGCTNKYTVNYKLGGATNMATSEMFMRGNEQTHNIYKGVYPWHTERSPESPLLSYQTTNQTPYL